jgi:hypothetical protein
LVFEAVREAANSYVLPKALSGGAKCFYAC